MHAHALVEGVMGRNSGRIGSRGDEGLHASLRRGGRRHLVDIVELSELSAGVDCVVCGPRGTVHRGKDIGVCPIQGNVGQGVVGAYRVGQVLLVLPVVHEPATSEESSEGGCIGG